MMDALEHKYLYNLIKKPSYKIWIIIILFIFSLFIFVFINVEYNKYYSNSAILIDKDTIKFYVNKKDLNKVTNNSNLIINNKNFAYNNITINDILFNDDYFYEIIVNVKLDDKMNIKNNFIDFKILLDSKTILEYIFKKIGGI